MAAASAMIGRRQHLSHRAGLVTDTGTHVICIDRLTVMAYPAATPSTRTFTLKLLKRVQALR